MAHHHGTGGAVEQPQQLVRLLARGRVRLFAQNVHAGREQVPQSVVARRRRCGDQCGIHLHLLQEAAHRGEALGPPARREEALRQLSRPALGGVDQGDDIQIRHRAECRDVPLLRHLATADDG